MSDPQITVIIPTCNSARWLERLIRSLKGERVNHEILIVDCGSIDETLEIAKKYGVEVIVTEGERSRARNVGAAKARSEVLLFLDSDMEVSRGLLEECIDLIGHFDALVIPEVTLGGSLLAIIRRFERSKIVGSGIFEAARCYRRNVFMGLGGFDEDLAAGEDYDLHLRAVKAGYKVGYTRRFLFHHEEDLSLRDHLRKKIYYAKYLRIYTSKHEESRKQFTSYRFVEYVKILRRDTSWVMSPLVILVLMLKAIEGLAVLLSSRNIKFILGRI